MPQSVASISFAGHWQLSQLWLLGRRFLAAISLIPALERAPHLGAAVRRQALVLLLERAFPMMQRRRCSPGDSEMAVASALLRSSCACRRHALTAAFCRYYMKRATRILPAYYSVLAILHGVILPSVHEGSMAAEIWWAPCPLCYQPQR